MTKHSPEVQQLLDQLKQETSIEMGIELGVDQTAKMNGSVGGRMTQKLIQLGQIKLLEMQQQINNNPSTDLKQPFYVENNDQNTQYLQ